MSSEVKVGLIGETEHTVTDQDTAARWRSGLVDAYSTPTLIGLAENACVIAVEKHLNDDQTSVGIEVSVKHLAATPVGMTVKAKAELVEVNGRRLKFRVEAWDEKEKVCEGWHSRAIVDRSRFVDKLKQKAKL
ncbi:MAG TPA: thioesterase family protein [Methylomirabilota bacterium]|nr:thioesterase family protein [Methylomirabilota bacterium]